MIARKSFRGRIVAADFPEKTLQIAVVSKSSEELFGLVLRKARVELRVIDDGTDSSGSVQEPGC